MARTQASVWLWNLVDLERLKWEGAEALAPGRHTIEFEFRYDGLGAGRVFKNKPAPDNLEVPQHAYLSDSRLLIGEDKKA